MAENCILVVDDEPKLVRLVREILTAMGHKVLSTGKGETAVNMVAMEQPDLILLDIVLSGEMDGYDVARRVREFSDIPIIMLTAKTREIDLLQGFDAGADDYLTKPFSSKELLVRLDAVLRRSKSDAGERVEAEISCGRLRMDLARRLVKVEGRDIHLSKTEYNLLYELAKQRNNVVLHEQLLGAVWGPEYRDDLEYLRAYIRYLRRKLEENPSQPEMIITCQGVGYMLVCPDEVEA